MRHMLFSVAAAALALPAVPAAAQDAPPAASADAIDAERLALAEEILSIQMPPGILGEVMTGLFENAVPAMGDMRVGQIMQIGGLPKSEVEAMGDTKMSEIMEIFDPYWEERIRIVMRPMTALYSRMEPMVRDLYIKSYARRFSAAELREILAFARSETGTAFLQHQWRMALDPTFMQDMMAEMPDLMADMNFEAIQEEITEAQAALPPPREFSDLTPAERTRLAELLGITVAELKANWGSEQKTVVVLPAK